jgi:hypothetical protein
MPAISLPDFSVPPVGPSHGPSLLFYPFPHFLEWRSRSMRPWPTGIRSIRWRLFPMLSFSDVFGGEYAGGTAFLRLLMIRAVVVLSS